MKPLTALSFAALVSSLSPSLWAERAFLPPKTDDEARARIALVEQHFAAESATATRWYWGWTGLFAGASAVSFGSLLVLDDKGLRADAVVGGTLAGVGALSTVALPLTASSGDAELRAMPDATPEARAAKLTAAEAMLTKAAQQERFLSGWAAHAGVFGANLAGAAVSRWAYHRPWDMIALTRGVGTVVGEIKVFTTPTAAMGGEARYLKSVGVVPTAGGLVVVGTF